MKDIKDEIIKLEIDKQNKIKERLLIDPKLQVIKRKINDKIKELDLELRKFVEDLKTQQLEKKIQRLDNEINNINGEIAKKISMLNKEE